LEDSAMMSMNILIRKKLEEVYYYYFKTCVFFGFKGPGVEEWFI
jgi:hypothetical protein